MAVQKVQKNGRTKWRARVRVDGRLVTSFHDRQDAAKRAEATMRAPKPTASAMTLDELWPRVLAYQTSGAARKPWRASSVRAHGQRWDRISPVLGKLTLDQITQANVDAFAASMTGARNTVAATLDLLRLVLRRAAKWGLVFSVPEISARQDDARVEDSDWLTQDELPLVLAKLPPKWRRVAIVAARTGLRVGELQALRWCDVETGRVHVRRTWNEHTRTFGPPKNGKPRTVAMPSDAAAVLEERGRSDELVFGDLARGRVDHPFVRATYGEQIGNAAKAAGLRKAGRSHVMRHTWASHCVLVGVPTRVLMEAAGWGSEKMVARYAHLRPADGDHYFERLSGVTTGVPTPKLRVLPGRTG